MGCSFVWVGSLARQWGSNSVWSIDRTLWNLRRSTCLWCSVGGTSLLHLWLLLGPFVLSHSQGLLLGIWSCIIQRHIFLAWGISHASLVSLAFYRCIFCGIEGCLWWPWEHYLCTLSAILPLFLLQTLHSSWFGRLLENLSVQRTCL